MKKINIALLASALFILAVFILTGCRARKVSTETKVSTSVSSTTKVFSERSGYIDTGKTLVTKVTDKKLLAYTDDSSYTETNITPKPGTVSKVGPDGTFYGEIESVLTKRITGTKKAKTIDSKVEENAREQKGIYFNYTSDSSHWVRDSTHLQIKVKKVDAKPSFGAWPWVAGIVVVLVVVIALWWFFGKPKS